MSGDDQFVQPNNEYGFEQLVDTCLPNCSSLETRGLLETPILASLQRDVVSRMCQQDGNLYRFVSAQSERFIAAERG